MLIIFVFWKHFCTLRGKLMISYSVMQHFDSWLCCMLIKSHQSPHQMSLTLHREAACAEGSLMLSCDLFIVITSSKKRKLAINLDPLNVSNLWCVARSSNVCITESQLIISTKWDWAGWSAFILRNVKRCFQLKAPFYFNMVQGVEILSYRK